MRRTLPPTASRCAIAGPAGPVQVQVGRVHAAGDEALAGAASARSAQAGVDRPGGRRRCGGTRGRVTRVAGAASDAVGRARPPSR